EEPSQATAVTIRLDRAAVVTPTVRAATVRARPICLAAANVLDRDPHEVRATGGVMSGVLRRLLPLMLAFACLAGAVRAQQPDRPPGLSLGDAVVTGFSGTLAPDAAQPRPANKSVVDLTFINPDGPSARIFGLGRPGYVWDGRLFQ